MFLHLKYSSSPRPVCRPLSSIAILDTYALSLASIRTDCPFIRLQLGSQTSDTCTQNGMRKDFLSTRHSLLSLFFYFFVRPAFLYCEEFVYTYTHTHI